jgi:hypothetical protein
MFSNCLNSLESIWTGKDFGSVSSEKLRDGIQAVRIVFYEDYSAGGTPLAERSLSGTAIDASIYSESK